MKSFTLDSLVRSSSPNQKLECLPLFIVEYKRFEARYSKNQIKNLSSRLRQLERDTFNKAIISIVVNETTARAELPIFVESYASPDKDWRMVRRIIRCSRLQSFSSIDEKLYDKLRLFAKEAIPRIYSYVEEYNVVSHINYIERGTE